MKNLGRIFGQRVRTLLILVSVSLLIGTVVEHVYAANPPAANDSGITQIQSGYNISISSLPANAEQIPCDGNNYANNNYLNNVFLGGPMIAINWTPQRSETITRIEVFTRGPGSDRLAIWSDDGMGPSSKPMAPLGYTSNFSAVSTNSWQGADLTSPVSVTANTKYWVVWKPTGGEQSSVTNASTDIQQDYWGSYSGTVTGGASWFGSITGGPFSFTDHRWKFRMFCGPEFVGPEFVYSAKFVCGNGAKFKGPFSKDAVAPATYYTEINVHNPQNITVNFTKKVALAPEEGFRIPPSNKTNVALNPDFAFEIDCTDMSRIAGPIWFPGFDKGFVVITSPKELDVVGVYSSESITHSITLDVEPIKPKLI